jgi:ApbE superfamily uncharacterized protein (UPF0280 family)
VSAVREIDAAGRWHYRHGPIDVHIDAAGARDALAEAHAASWQCFSGILPALVAELAGLRSPLPPAAAGQPCPLKGPVARRMWHACVPLCADFITPMAAVAGAVADELLLCYRREGITRALVNNGGDIALHLTEPPALRIGICADIAAVVERSMPGAGAWDAILSIAPENNVGGVATSGWRGRSFSLGIADSATVLGRTAALADAAATIIANAVNLENERILRAPAQSLKDESDLGERLVTVAVPELTDEEVASALERGLARARGLQASGVVAAAALFLQGRCRVMEPLGHAHSFWGEQAGALASQPGAWV